MNFVLASILSESICVCKALDFYVGDFLKGLYFEVGAAPVFELPPPGLIVVTILLVFYFSGIPVLKISPRLY